MASKTLLSEKDIQNLEERLKEVFVTKKEFQKYRSDLFDKLDTILKEVQTSREEQTVIGHRLADHENRLETLEESRPST